MRGTLVESDISLAKRNMKDSIFRRAFSDRGLVLELYKDLHPEAEDVSEDEVKDLQDELQKLTDKFAKDIDVMIEAKSKEIMTV